MSQTFSVKAFRAEAVGVTRLTISAPSQEAVRAIAQKQGYTVLSVKAASNRRSFTLASNRTLGAVAFSSELLPLLRAGLHLPEALSALQTRRRSPQAAQVIGHIHSSLQEGHPLSRAVAGSGGEFTELYVATIKSSEETGDLVSALTRFLDYDQKMTRVRTTVINASLYPSILLSVGVLAVGFLLGYVIPRFSRIYTQLGDNRIPAASRWLMHLGQFIGAHRPLLGLLLLASVSVIAAASSSVSMRALVISYTWRLPVLGQRLLSYQLARFSHTLAMLLRGGMPFVTALDMTASLLRIESLQANLAAARKFISEGGGIAAGFSQYQLASDVCARMIAAGERTGNMPEMMQHVAELYDSELNVWVERFARTFEPVLMTCIGATIGVLVLLMYLPIFGLASSLE